MSSDFMERLRMAGIRYHALWVAGAAIGVHLLLFVYDLVIGFQPFLRGDRTGGRMETMQRMVAASPNDWLRFAADAPVVPGEYLFQTVPYALGGTGGIILFQIALTIASIVCVARLAQSLLPWRFAGLVAGLVYMLLPQNIAYPHQFVTEAISTPFCVFFLYLMVGCFRGGGWKQGVGAGLCLGVAIFSRPSLALVAPALLGLALIQWRVVGRQHVLDLGLTCVAAAAPIAVWVVIFTAVTGHVGYTSGVANLGWNLRSKVFLTQTARGLEKPPEVQAYTTYADLYRDSGGIGVGRFLQIAGQNPVAYIKAAVSDASIVMFKANSTKLTVDYFGIGREDGIKEWRNILEAQGTGGLMRWAARHPDAVVPFALEIACSVLTIGVGLAVGIFIVIALIAPAKVSQAISIERFGLLLVTAAMLFAVVVSAEMVDRAQARLRHPAEAAMLLAMGILLVYLQASSRRRTAILPEQGLSQTGVSVCRR